MTMLAECDLCYAPTATWFSKMGRDICRCSRCQAVLVPAQIAEIKKSAAIYEDSNPIFFQDGSDAYYIDETNIMSAQKKKDWILKFVPKQAELLDMGANFGHFLKTLGEDFKTTGIEISPVAVEWSIKNFQVNNHVGSVYAVPQELVKEYDAVSLWDVIEHVPEAQKALQGLNRLLKKDGYLFLSTPDVGSLVAKIMGRYWHYIDPVQHIILFNRQILSELLEKAGFEVVEIRTFGHYYRLRYILDRLAWFYQKNALGYLFKTARFVAAPFCQLKFYIHLRDVMGIAARKVKDV